MTLSCISTFFHLYPARNLTPVRSGLSVFSDFVIACFLIGLLIPSWIILAGDWNGGRMMLGAYATVPMMITLYVSSSSALFPHSPSRSSYSPLFSWTEGAC